MDTSDLDSYVKETFGVDPGAYLPGGDSDAPAAAAPVPETPPADQPVAAADTPPATDDASGAGPSGATVQGQPDSPMPAGDVTLADNTQATPLDTPGQGGGSTAGQAADGDSKLVVTDSSDPPTSITADTLNDFITQTNQVFGGNPHCNISQSVSFYINEKNICSGVIVTIETAIVRPRLGLSRASGKERDLINTAAALIADHERQHRSIVQTSFADLPGKMLGQTEDKARKTLAAFMAKEDAAQKAFDAAHGKLVIVTDSQGNPTDVSTGPL